MNSQKLALVSAVVAALALSACSSSTRVSGVPNQTAIIQAENGVILPETLESKKIVYEDIKSNTQKELKDYAARQYAKDGVALPVATEVNGYSMLINGKDFYRGDADLKSLLGGGNNLSIVESARLKVGNELYNVARATKGTIYQNQYSVVGGLELSGWTVKNTVANQTGRLSTTETPNTYRDIEMLMKGTATEKMPIQGSAVYRGFGVEGGNVGAGGYSLEYTVNFDDKSGSGTLKTGVLGGEATVELAKSHFGNSAQLIHTNRLDGTMVKGFGISGAAIARLEGAEDVERVPFPARPLLGSNSLSDADNSGWAEAWNNAVLSENKRNQQARFSGAGSYDLAFFGPNAQEIAGLVKLRHNESYLGEVSLAEKSIAFGGVRDPITTTTPNSSATGNAPAGGTTTNP